jgi:nucleoside-triphosphatase
MAQRVCAPDPLPYRGWMPRQVISAKVLVTGPPKSGKTTAVVRLVELLRAQAVPVGGFVTGEQREDGRRVGFVVRDLAGPSATLAHEDFNSPVRVGRFGVDVAGFERVGLPALRKALAHGRGVVVIDEVASMELASPAFAGLVEEALASTTAVVATVHAKSDPFTDSLKRRADTRVVSVDEESRDGLPQRLLAMLTSP